MANETRIEHASETWLADSTVFEVNRVPAHSDHKCYAHDPQTNEWSDLRQSLDGEWKVRIEQARNVDVEKRSVRGRRFRGWRFRRDRGAGPLADGRLSQEQVRQHPISVGRSRGSAGAKYSGKQPCGDLPPSIRARRAACAHAGKRRHGQPHLPRCRHRDLRMA